MAILSDGPAWGWWDRLWPCYSCCHDIWIPSLGTFSPQCLGVLGHIPMWIALLTVTLRYGVGPVWHRFRPMWLRSFAAEEHDKSGPDVDHELGGSAAAGRKAWSPWTVCLLLIAICGAALGIVGAATWRDMTQVFLAPVIPHVTSTLVLVLERPRTAPSSILVIGSTTLLVNVALQTMVPGISGNGLSQLTALTCGILLPCLSVAVILNMPLRDPQLDDSRIGKPFTEPNFNVSSPEDVITLWQWMTVSWITPLMSIGLKRQLHQEDVWQLASEFQHGRLHMLFRELRGSVLARLLKANGLDLVLTTGLGVLKMALDLADPILLKQLLGAFASDTSKVRTAVTYATIAFAARLVKAQVQVFSIWISRRAYERCRGELITMAYEKALRRKAFTFPGDHEAIEAALASDDEQEEVGSEGISGATTFADSGSQISDNAEQGNAEPSGFNPIASWFHRGYRALRPQRHQSSVPSTKTKHIPSSTGKILSLLQGDIYDIAQRFWDVADITTKPLTFIISVILIWNILGPAALSGVVTLFICMFINTVIVKWQLRVEEDRRKTSDLKQERTSQFVESIRHLRWYDWQDSWLERIMETREAELAKRITASILMVTMKHVSILGSLLFPVVAFLAYTVVSGKPLTVDVAFPAMDLFDMLQTSLSEIPNLVKTLMNSRISMRRLERFMLEPDKEDEDWEAWDETKNQDGPPGKLEISMTNASFSWPQSPKQVLNDISFACGAGLTMICGKVGFGKSALLQSILGELDQNGGEKTVPAEMIGYCAQTPWLESMSIRDNILFSAGYDSTRYEQVIDACCLRDDFSLFKSKDLTLIGENGVGLSGGQKARVALARAVYSRARILLLDDPIAALDHHTATSILQNLFADKNSALTAGRMVIFVTHRVDVVQPYAYQVLEVRDGGQVQTFGTEELENNERLRQLAASAAAHEVAAEIPSEEEDDQTAPEKLIEEEHRAHGGVLASVYWQFIKTGKLRWWLTVLTLFVVYRFAKIGFFWFVKEWGEAYGENPKQAHSVLALGFGFNAQDMQHAVVSQQIFKEYGSNSTNKSWLGQHLPPPDKNVKPWLLWFLVLSLVQFFAMFGADLAVIVITYITGKNMFAQTIKRVANATFRFYDVTPVGRLMNRLTSDMNTVDGGIAGQCMSVTWSALGWLASITVIATVTPPFLLISICMSGLFIYVFNYFLPASQSLRRLEFVSLSPLFSNFGNLLNGLTTVRAFRAQPHFQARNIISVDSFQRMDHFYWSVQAWLEYRYVILSAITTFTLTLTAIASGLSSGVVAFVLASASNFVRSTQTLCKSYGDLQMQFVSVERIIELLSLDQEDPGTVLPPAAWPVYGDDIVFDNVTIRYAPHLEPVLKNVTFTIPGGSNVAVTGRTGSGKTTLVYSLLSTLQPDPETGGAIHIGPVNLSTVDKHALRRNITFVAQDPVLFAGTLRDNLDPTKEKTDAECESILQQVLGESGDFTLESKVDGGGKNLSQGQRQLVGLARAILRRSPVVVMDEATASIDRETAARIQRLLREELKQSTVITIAHRVEAVAEADFEIVMEKGRVVRAGPRDAVGGWGV